MKELIKTLSTFAIIGMIGYVATVVTQLKSQLDVIDNKVVFNSQAITIHETRMVEMLKDFRAIDGRLVRLETQLKLME